MNTFADDATGSYKYEVAYGDWCRLGITAVRCPVGSVLPVGTMKVSIENHSSRSDVDMAAYGYAFMAMNRGIRYSAIFTYRQRGVLLYADNCAAAVIDGIAQAGAADKTFAY